MLCTTLTRGVNQKLSACTMWLVTLLAMLTTCTGPQPSSAEALLDSIFPSDYLGYGNSYNFRAKRVFSDTSSQCSLCILTYDPDSCLRCWASKSAIIPVHAMKRSDDAEDLLLGGDSEGEEEVASVAKRAYGYGTVGCTCCAHSKNTNQYCCNLCRASTKRSGQRSMTSGSSSTSGSSYASGSPVTSTRQRWQPIYTSPLFRGNTNRKNYRSWQY
ncbi:uncharacterized protein [Littorina saxatilis]|uniref:Uncharacterized protein n=1 Tax=Littorina saxatilis TaxID=31220 RepID=A0AAN9C2E5_9CAEN